MWKASKVCFSLFCFWFSLSFSGNAVAATAPWVYGDPGNVVFPPMSDAAAVCSARGALIGQTLTPGASITAGSAGVFSGAWGTFKYPSGAAGTRCVNSSGNVMGYAWYGQFCGPGVTVSGAAPSMTCSACPSGFVEANGQCIPPPQCDSAGSRLGWPMGLRTDATSAPAETVCVNNCEYDVLEDTWGPAAAGTGFAQVVYQGISTGNVCGGASPTSSGSDPFEVPPLAGENPDGPEDCPPGTGFVKFGDGPGSCYPSGVESTKETASGSSSSSSGGSSSSSQVETKKVGEDGTVETTTTKTVEVGGETYSSQVTSKGGGAGGDDLGPPPVWSAPELPQVENPTGPVLQPFEVNTGVFGGGGGACPAPVTFSVFGREYAISLQPACDMAGMFRIVLLIMSAFAAMRIVTS
jgi:hypothetical protein